ncbi:hypothetical protein SNE40_000977 [Patella caerulea]|uniref:Fork-head domain-containing protein n=1 Tax=Patella caerulea TaxID=87958 RepID=A0AAN8KEZ7_PATCE
MIKMVKTENQHDAVEVPSFLPQVHASNGKSNQPIEMAPTRISVNGNVNAKKPSVSYIGLISMAIQSSSQRKMLLSDIYQWIVNNFPYYKMEDRSWRNSVRHNLSLNECFIKCGRSENGKSHYWTIHPANMHCFSAGDYRRRHARQLVRKCDDDLERLCNDSEDSVKCVQEFSRHPGYVPMLCQRVSVEFIKNTFGEEVLRTSSPKHAIKCEEESDSFYY